MAINIKNNKLLDELINTNLEELINNYHQEIQHYIQEVKLIKTNANHINIGQWVLNNKWIIWKDNITQTIEITTVKELDCYGLVDTQIYQQWHQHILPHINQKQQAYIDGELIRLNRELYEFNDDTTIQLKGSLKFQIHTQHNFYTIKVKEINMFNVRRCLEFHYKQGLRMLLGLIEEARHM